MVILMDVLGFNLREQLYGDKLGYLLHFMVLLEGTFFKGRLFSFGEVDEFFELF